MAQWRNQRGISSLGEYAVTVFLVVMTLTAMSLYVQRTLQARIRDARHYMVNQAKQSCDIYCGDAAGLSKWTVNITDPNINTSCDNLSNNLECAQQQGLLSEQTMPEQYEPYYAHVVSQVASAGDKNKGLKVSTSKTGTFYAQDNSQNQSQSTSSTSGPTRSGTKDDVWLVSEGQ